MYLQKEVRLLNLPKHLPYLVDGWDLVPEKIVKIGIPNKNTQQASIIFLNSSGHESSGIVGRSPKKNLESNICVQTRYQQQSR